MVLCTCHRASRLGCTDTNIQLLGPHYNGHRRANPFKRVFNVCNNRVQLLHPRADITHSGRSTLSRDCDNIVISNPPDGVSWYSLSNSKPVSSSKIPISKGSSVSSLTYIDGGNAIVVGGLSGQAYILDCQTFDTRQELNHNGPCALCLLLCD